MQLKWNNSKYNTYYIYIEILNSLDSYSYNCLKGYLQKALMALSSSPKSKIIKADNQFNGYVFNFTHDQKTQSKNMRLF